MAFWLKHCDWNFFSFFLPSFEAPSQNVEYCAIARLIHKSILILFIACVRQHGSLFHDCIMFDKSIKLENVRCHVRLRLKQLRFQQLPLNVSQRSEHDLYFNIFEIKFSTLHNHILLLVSGAYFCGYVSNIVLGYIYAREEKKYRKTAHNLLDVCACVFLKTFGLFVERPLFSLSTAKASLLTVAL